MIPHYRQSQKAKIFQYLFLILACLVLLCIVVQTLLAGIALFTDSAYWNHHDYFVKTFTYLPLLLLVTAFAGRLSAHLRWSSFGLFVLIFLQYFTANFNGAGALHPVIALVLFWLSATTVQHGFRSITAKKPVRGDGEGF